MANSNDVAGGIHSTFGVLASDWLVRPQETRVGIKEKSRTQENGFLKL